MINLLVTTILCLAVSIIISGVAVGMGSNSGWAAAGKEAAEACVLIIIAYVIFTAVYKTGVGYEGIPFADCLENYESLKDLMTNDPSTFVFNVAELITVTLIMSLLAKVIPSSTGGKGLIGKILFKILLVMLALAANHYVDYSGLPAHPGRSLAQPDRASAHLTQSAVQPMLAAD